MKRFSATRFIFTGMRAVVILPVLLAGVLLGAASFSSMATTEPRTIVVAISNNYYPLAGQSLAGEPSGMLVDFWRLWSEKTGVEVEFLITNWTDTLAAVKDGRADVHVGLSRNQQRAGWLAFTRTLYEVTTSVYYWGAENYIESMADLSGKTVAVYVESQQEAFLANHYPDIRVKTYDDSRSIFVALSRGEVAAAIIEDVGVEGELSQYGIQGSMNSWSDPLMRDSIHGAVLVSRQPLLALVNRGFSAISLAEYQAIEGRWVSDPDLRVFRDRGAPFSLTMEERQWLEGQTEISVGVLSDWPPLAFLGEDGLPTGISMAFANAVNERLGGRLKFYPGEWKSHLEDVKSGRMDVLMDIKPTSERQPFYHFTQPYLKVPHAIVGQVGDAEYRSLRRLHGKTVALERGFVTADVLRQDYPDIAVREYEDTIEAMQAVSAGEADAYVGNRYVAAYLIDAEGMDNLEITGNVQWEPSNLTFGIRKDWPVLREILDKALHSIDDEERQRMVNAWLPDRQAEELDLTLREKQWLSTHLDTPIRVQVGTSPPLHYHENGASRGLAIAYMDEVMDRIGLTPEYVPLVWQEAFPAIQQRERIDVLPSMSRSPARERLLNMTNDYISFPIVIFTRRDGQIVTLLSDLNGRTVAVEKDHLIYERLKQDYPAMNFELVQTSEEAIRQLYLGAADAYVGNLAIGSYWIQTHGLQNIKVAAPTDYANDPKAMGVRKDWPELASIINKVLASLSDEDHAQIRNSVLSVRFEHGIDWATVRLWSALITGLFILVILVIIAWNRRLGREISERVRVEAELKRARALAEEATQAKSNFLANMSHEIRTPMNAIIGMTHLAQTTDLDNIQRGYLSKVAASANALLGIINDILDFSKIEAGRLDIEQIEFDLNEVISNIANMVAVKAAEKELEFVVGVAGDVPLKLIGDPLRLGQILINLTNNAVKFSSEGEVIVKVEKGEVEGDQIELIFSVTDTGIGMSPQEQGRLFRSFSQADTSTTRKFGGTGLGLVISKQLAELMGGSIGVESQKGVGSTFFVTARFGFRPEEKRRLRLPDAELKGRRILVVDDNGATREVLVEMLSSFSFEALAAESGSEALAVMAKQESAGEPIDLALIDAQMPAMSGLETIHAISHSSKLKAPPLTVMMTAYGQESFRNSASQAGITDVLLKPVSPSALFNKLVTRFGHAVKETEAGVQKGSQDLAGIQGARLLLVEDNEINQEVAKEILGQAGFEVVVANNGQEALDILRSENQFDGVLMDIQMPVMDGYEATRVLRRNDDFATLPVIAMTANVMAGDREKAISAGMNDHVGKPIDLDELFAVLVKWIKPKDTN